MHVLKLKIIHRDIRPESLVFDDKMMIKLTNFELAVENTRLGEKLEKFGSPYY